MITRSIALVLCLITFGPVTELARCQTTENGPNGWLDVLRNDVRLKDPVAIKFKSKPGSLELLDLVHNATGVKVKLAEEPKEGKIVLGDMLGKGPAWKIMHLIAMMQFKDGRWEKVDDGYVLHGNPKVVMSPDAEKKHLAGKKALEAAFAKKAARATRFPLRDDARLNTNLSIIGDDPPLAEILKRLERSTKLRFTLADNLEHHDPKLGRVKVSNALAYVVMEWMAQKDLDDGRWEKTEDGYRLEGTSRALRLPSGRTFPWGWAIVAIVGASLIATGGFVIYRRRAANKGVSQNIG